MFKNLILICLALSLPTKSFAAFVGVNASGVDLGHFDTIECSNGLTCTKAAGKFKVVSSSLSGPFTLESAEVMNNTVDDTIEFISNDEATNLKVTGFEAKNASLELAADQEDDTADSFSLVATTTNVLNLINGVTTLFSYSSAGVLTLPNSEILDASTTDDTIELKSNDEHTTVLVTGFEAKDARLVLSADQSDDNGDDWQLQAAQSGNAFTLSNDTSGSQVAKLTVSTAGAVSLVGDLSGDGGDQFVGYLQNQVTATATTLTAAECGSTVINAGAIEIELPEASTVLGCRYTFIVGNATAFDIDPDAADQIVLLTNAAGDRIEADAVGESVVLEAISASAWAPVGAEKGTWTDAN